MTPLTGRSEEDAIAAIHDPPVVLVVDDHADTAGWMAVLIRHMGCRVVSASDGRHAMEAADEVHPDLAFVDIRLPDLDGYEVARHIRRQTWGRETTLAAMTGVPKHEDQNRSRDAGFDCLLVKPADIPRMLNLMNEHCRPRSLG